MNIMPFKLDTFLFCVLISKWRLFDLKCL